MTFDIDETIQSQYATSPTITALVRGFWKAIDPSVDLDLLYRKMLDLDTAEGVGLDVWGRIVGMPREFIVVDNSSSYMGFKPDLVVYNPRLDTMNCAPFYAPVTGLYKLADPAYRTYIYLKALINIGDSSLASLNRMLVFMFPNAKIQLQHTGPMQLRLMILSGISDAEKSALLSLPWLPAGVGLDIYQIITPTFGFNGSKLNPFGQGTFPTETPHAVNAEDAEELTA